MIDYVNTAQLIKKILALTLALCVLYATAFGSEISIEGILALEPKEPEARPTIPMATSARKPVPEATAGPTPKPTPKPAATPASKATRGTGAMPEANYVGISQTNIAIREEMSREAAALGNIQEGERVYVVDYEPEWLLVVKGSEDNWVMGYVLRHTVWDIVSLKDGILPYGTTPGTYSAILGKDTALLTAPDMEADRLLTMSKGSKVAILEINDGWAKVIYWRQYAYFYLDAIEELTPVYDLASAREGDLISAFISFYKTTTDGLNPNRMENIALSCEYISIVMQPGDSFAFNEVAGPYWASRGYLMGMSYFEGEAVPSSGGGVCQVSSTLYNVLLPLNGGINIIYRRAHGPSGATYLPHGIDAAVGNKTLDLVFRNDFNFPVRIEASAHNGVLYISMLKA